MTPLEIDRRMGKLCAKILRDGSSAAVENELAHLQALRRASILPQMTKPKRPPAWRIPRR